MSRGTQLTGRHHYSIDLYGQDWPLAAGHRIGVLLTSSNAGVVGLTSRRRPP